MMTAAVTTRCMGSNSIPTAGRQQRLRSATAIRVLCCAALVHVAVWLITPGKPGPEAAASAAAMQAFVPSAQPNRRQLLASAGIAASTLASKEQAAWAGAAGMNTKVAELIEAPRRPKDDIVPYQFQKPAGFKRLANAVDPTSFVFRSEKDSYFSVVTRSEARQNASKEFTPAGFIADYEQKFVNSTGSSFQLIRGGTTPVRIDQKLDVKYYEVEYVVRTQLGFTFDTLRSLHFTTVFAAAPQSIVIMNCCALDDKWDKDSPTLENIIKSFAVTA